LFSRSHANTIIQFFSSRSYGSGIPDEDVLAFAVSHEQAVLTLNRGDFIRLHRSQPNHAGIIICTQDNNWERQATRIDDAISSEETLTGKLIRVNRPSQ
jgi:TRAP-type C4-dicarboxylate transport system substrate-binding protein